MQAAKLFLQQLTHVALKMEFRLARAHIQLWRAQEVECRLLAAKINSNYIFISRTQPPCALREAKSGERSNAARLRNKLPPL